MLEWQCDKNREDLLVEKKLKKYTLPVIAAILTVFALSMTGLYAGSADNPGETFLSLCKKEMTGIGIDKRYVLIQQEKSFDRLNQNPPRFRDCHVVTVPETGRVC